MQTLINAYQAQDWEMIDQIIRQIIKQYLDKKDSQGLVLFWQNFLKEQADNDQFARITSLVQDMSEFRANIAHILRAGVEKLQSDDNIKAFYYEYYYDGSDESTGNLFLCLDFNTDNGEWASNFDDLINGGVIAQYFDYDTIGNGTLPAIIAEHYVHSVLLNAFIDELKNYPLTIPVGFASHDNNYRIVVIMPNNDEIVVI